MASCRISKRIGTGLLARFTDARTLCRAAFATKSKEDPQPEFSTLADDVTDQLEEVNAEIQRKRNKSGLTVAHRNILHGRRPYQEPKCDAHTTVLYNRKLFGRYGRQSGIDPATLWPTKMELEDRHEYEKVAFPDSVAELVEKARDKVRQEERAIEERQTKIMNNLKKLAQWKKDVNDRAAKKLEESRVAREKKEALIEEVRRHFGFKVHPSDERFKEMLAQKEKAQKKKRKEEKAKLRGEKVLAKMMEETKGSQS